MRVATGAFRTWVVTAALMLAIGVVACADDDASAPGEFSSAEPTDTYDWAEEPAEAPEEAAEKKAGSTAEPEEDSPDGSGPPEEEEAPEAERE